MTLYKFQHATFQFCICAPYLVLTLKVQFSSVTIIFGPLPTLPSSHPAPQVTTILLSAPMSSFCLFICYFFCLYSAYDFCPFLASLFHVVYNTLKSIHVVTNVSISSFSWVSSSPSYICTPHFLYPIVYDDRLGCFHFWLL